MDLNALYHRRGVSLLKADRAACDRSRSEHQGLARAHAIRIAEALRKCRAVPA